MLNPIRFNHVCLNHVSLVAQHPDRRGRRSFGAGGWGVSEEVLEKPAATSADPEKAPLQHIYATSILAVDLAAACSTVTCPIESSYLHYGFGKAALRSSSPEIQPSRSEVFILKHHVMQHQFPLKRL